MAKRIKLRVRLLPDYTRGEEIFNMVSHIVGGGFGVIALVTCVIKASFNRDAYQIVSAAIYGFSMVLLYTMSSVYHGLVPVTAKKVFQIIDHCAVFILIAGTYTPFALCSLREYNTALGWCLFGFVWATTALGVTLNAIDLKKYSIFSNICYIAVGWCIVFVIKYTIQAISIAGFWWLLAGGISYTIGAVLYIIAGKFGCRYMHSIFHLFVLLGTLLHAVCVFFYVLV